MPASRRHRRPRQSGHAMLEAALVIVPLLALLLGIFDVGQMLYLQQTLTERVRAAARFGAVHAADLPAVQNMVLYGSPRPAGNAILGLRPADVHVTREGQGTAEDRIRITVSGMRYSLIAPLLAGARDLRSVSATLPVESAE
ncbi:MAG: pilus assembly protein [Bryobacterales bacterium]|nr:pilus assembly protein [Bryobacterales bacterium]